MFTSTLIADWTHSVFEATWLASNTSLSCTSELSLCPKFSRLTLISRKPRESPLSKFELRSKMGGKRRTRPYFFRSSQQALCLSILPRTTPPRADPNKCVVEQQKSKSTMFLLLPNCKDFIQTLLAKAFPDRVLESLALSVVLC